MKYIKETIIGQGAFNDLDIIFQGEILGEDNESNYLFIPDTENLKSVWKKGDYISVFALQNIIKSLRKRGATHFQIYPHCDHHGYYITGVKLEEASEEDGKKLMNLDLEKEIEERKETLRERQAMLDAEKLEIEKLNNKLCKI